MVGSIFLETKFLLRNKKGSMSSVKVKSRTLHLAMDSKSQVHPAKPNTGLQGMAQLIKYLLCKYQNPSSDPQHPCKKLGMVMHL